VIKIFLCDFYDLKDLPMILKDISMEGIRDFYDFGGLTYAIEDLYDFKML
jgi:hypothetical protein